MTTRAEITAEIDSARLRIKQLEHDLENIDDYPVGTILHNEDAGGSYGAYAIKQARIYATHRAYLQSSVPTWVIIFDDFSGGSFESLAALKTSYAGEWKKIK